MTGPNPLALAQNLELDKAVADAYLSDLVPLYNVANAATQAYLVAVSPALDRHVEDLRSSQENSFQLALGPNPWTTMDQHPSVLLEEFEALFAGPNPLEPGQNPRLDNTVANADIDYLVTLYDSANAATQAYLVSVSRNLLQALATRQLLDVNFSKPITL